MAFGPCFPSFDSEPVTLHFKLSDAVRIQIFAQRIFDDVVPGHAGLVHQGLKALMLWNRESS